MEEERALRLPPLNSLRAFEAASRHLSFQKAAEELNVTPSALSYQIKTLEDYLGQNVFERGNRQVNLTEAGRNIQPFIADGFEQFSAAMKQLHADTPDNVIVVSCGPSHAAKWLAPRLYRFADAHPGLELRISASLQLVDFARDNVDVALRFGPGGYIGLHEEKMFDESLTAMLTPQLLSQGAALLSPDDLASYQLLHDDSVRYMGYSIGWIEWLQKAGTKSVNGKKGLRFTHADHCIEAAVNGAGVAMARIGLAAGDVTAGRLVRPFDIEIDTGLATYFVCPPAHMEREKNRKFRDWLFRELGCSAEGEKADAIKSAD